MLWILNDSGTYICRVYEGTEYIDSEPIMVTVENNPLEDDVANLNKHGGWFNW
jgi:hypothetical protein